MSEAHRSTERADGARTGSEVASDGSDPNPWTFAQRVNYRVLARLCSHFDAIGGPPDSNGAGWGSILLGLSQLRPDADRPALLSACDARTCPAGIRCVRAWLRKTKCSLARLRAPRLGSGFRTSQPGGCALLW